MGSAALGKLDTVCAERASADTMVRNPARIISPHLRFRIVLLLFAVLLPGSSMAQVAVTDWLALDARSTDGFTWVEEVRELADGRVIVLDRAERFVYLLDRDLSRIGVIGGRGEGPGEYLLPSAIVGLPGDSTGIFDAARFRVLVINPDASTGGFVPPRADVPLPRAPSGDAHGRLYVQGLPVGLSPGGQYTLLDSAAIERWHIDGAGPDTVAFVPVNLRPGARVTASGSTVSPPMTVAFAAVTVWAMGRDGTVAIGHPDPYRIELVLPDGNRRMGPVVQDQPVPLTEGHRAEWCAQQLRPVSVARGSAGQPTIYSVEVLDGPCLVPNRWPEVLPPFLWGAARFDAEGSLWVLRTGPAGGLPTYDVFDASGARLRQVRLPTGTRLVGFGNSSAYVVRVDELGLQWLERIGSR